MQPPSFQNNGTDEPQKPVRRHRGKIARLPKHVRDQVNQMLSDGLPYAEVIERLGEYGKHLNTDNVSSWEKGAYKEWQEDQFWFDQLYTRLDFAKDVLEDPAHVQLREASLAIVIKQMYDLIKGFDPAAFKELLAANPANYARILNSISKIAEVGLRYDAARAQQERGDRAKPTSLGPTEDMLRQYEKEHRLLRRAVKPDSDSVPATQEEANRG